VSVDSDNKREIAKGWEEVGRLVGSIIRQKDDPLMPKKLVVNAEEILESEEKVEIPNTNSNQD